MGGLGQIGIRLAKAMGCQVIVISRSEKKHKLANEFGADDFVISTDANSMAKHKDTFDLIINTIPSYHDYLQYSKLLNEGGKQVLLGLHNGFGAALLAQKVTCGKSSLTCSIIASVKETQD